MVLAVMKVMLVFLLSLLAVSIAKEKPAVSTAKEKPAPQCRKMFSRCTSNAQCCQFKDLGLNGTCKKFVGFAHKVCLPDSFPTPRTEGFDSKKCAKIGQSCTSNQDCCEGDVIYGSICQADKKDKNQKKCFGLIGGRQFDLGGYSGYPAGIVSSYPVGYPVAPQFAPQQFPNPFSSMYLPYSYPYGYQR